MHGRTTLIIAHRLKTVQEMDRILVLKDGAIAEQGTHDELFAKKGAYYELLRAQQAFIDPA
jgi:ABC-type multidrug transport system fused ATPase/permease subunit